MYRVGILYTSDQPVAQAATFTTQNKTQEKNIHAISEIRTCDFRNQGVANTPLTISTLELAGIYLYKMKFF